jgi:hypothetical protein
MTRGTGHAPALNPPSPTRTPMAHNPRAPGSGGAAQRTRPPRRGPARRTRGAGDRRAGRGEQVPTVVQDQQQGVPALVKRRDRSKVTTPCWSPSPRTARWSPPSSRVPAPAPAGTGAVRGDFRLSSMQKPPFVAAGRHSYGRMTHTWSLPGCAARGTTSATRGRTTRRNANVQQEISRFRTSHCHIAK